MKVAERNWLQLEACLERDDRAVLPLGSTEQHAYLSLAVDTILAERVALEAAEPLGVPVFPPLHYGLTPAFLAYPGTVSLRMGTYLEVVRDILDSLRRHGFRRVLLVNGHGGNSPVRGLLGEVMAGHPELRLKLHDWWLAPRTVAAAARVDPLGSHASWIENFPWTRLAGVELPEGEKPLVDLARLRLQDPAGVRQLLGDGNFGGRYQRSDADMLAIWRVAVEETRDLLEGPWS